MSQRLISEMLSRRTSEAGRSSSNKASNIQVQRKQSPAGYHSTTSVSEYEDCLSHISDEEHFNNFMKMATSSPPEEQSAHAASSPASSQNLTPSNKAIPSSQRTSRLVVKIPSSNKSRDEYVEVDLDGEKVTAKLHQATPTSSPAPPFTPSRKKIVKPKNSIRSGEESVIPATPEPVLKQKRQSTPRKSTTPNSTLPRLSPSNTQEIIELSSAVEDSDCELQAIFPSPKRSRKSRPQRRPRKQVPTPATRETKSPVQTPPHSYIKQKYLADLPETKKGGQRKPSSINQESPVCYDLTLLSSSKESDFNVDEHNDDDAVDSAKKAPPHSTTTRQVSIDTQHGKEATISSRSPSAPLTAPPSDQPSSACKGDSTKEPLLVANADTIVKDEPQKPVFSSSPVSYNDDSEEENGSDSESSEEGKVMPEESSGSESSENDETTSEEGSESEDSEDSASSSECSSEEERDVPKNPQPKLQPTAGPRQHVPLPAYDDLPRIGCDAFDPDTPSTGTKTYRLQPSYGRHSPFPDFDRSGRTGRYKPHHRDELIGLRGILKHTNKVGDAASPCTGKGQKQSSRGKSLSKPSTSSSQLQRPSNAIDVDSNEKSAQQESQAASITKPAGSVPVKAENAASDITSATNHVVTPKKEDISPRTIKHDPRNHRNNLSSIPPYPHTKNKPSSGAFQDNKEWSEVLKRSKERPPRYSTSKALGPTVERLKKRIEDREEPSERNTHGRNMSRAVEAELEFRGLRSSQSKDTFMWELAAEYSRILAGYDGCLLSMWVKAQNDLHEECAELRRDLMVKPKKEEPKQMTPIEALIAYGEGYTDESSVTDSSDSDGDNGKDTHVFTKVKKADPAEETTAITGSVFANDTAKDPIGLVTPDPSPSGKGTKSGGHTSSWVKAEETRSTEYCQQPFVSPMSLGTPSAKRSLCDDDYEMMATEARLKRRKSDSAIARLVQDSLRKKLVRSIVAGKEARPVAQVAQGIKSFYTTGWKKQLHHPQNRKGARSASCIVRKKTGERSAKQLKREEAWWEAVTEMLKVG